MVVVFFIFDDRVLGGESANGDEEMEKRKLVIELESYGEVNKRRT